MTTKDEFIKSELKLSVQELKDEYKEAPCVSIHQLLSILDKWEQVTLKNFGVLPEVNKPENERQ